MNLSVSIKQKLLQIMQNQAHRPHPVKVQRLMLEPVLWKALLVTAFACLIWEENIRIEVGAVSLKKIAHAAKIEQGRHDLLYLFGSSSPRSPKLELEEDTLSHIASIMDPTYANRFGLDEATVMENKASCEHFIKLFSPVAIAEMRHFGVPASILLAQALLASDGGQLAASLASNNFFMRPCHLETCPLEHFDHDQQGEVTVTCDIFPSLWGSFRAQCQYFRRVPPYNDLQKADFKAWITALDDVGYSNDPLYGRKIAALIQTFQLDKVDLR